MPEALISLHDAASYRRHLLCDILPFWRRHAVDVKSGGLFTCLADDGTKVSGDKYLWSQCRAVWTFSAVFNHIERAPEHLHVAENIANFVLRHGRDEEGRYLYRVSENGEPLEGPVSVYADFFAAYGFAELYRATAKSAYLEEALRVLKQAVKRTMVPGFDELAPYRRPEGVVWIHGVAMILLETVQEVALSALKDEELRAWCRQAAETIMTVHVRPERKLLLEHLGKGKAVLDTPPGMAVSPGHAIESMWFVAHHALRVNDPARARLACEVIRWHLEKGWDAEFGGLFLAVDAVGGEPWWPHAEKKIWWPHTEAIYALHLARTLTGESWCDEWLEKILSYSLAHFVNHHDGEWFQRLNRQGEPIREVIALPVKDPFHLPRALIRTIQMLEGGLPQRPPIPKPQSNKITL